MAMKMRVLAVPFALAVAAACGGSSNTGSGGAGGGSTQSTGSSMSSAHGGSGGGVLACNQGDTHDCYTGPEGTRDVGLCKAGTQKCLPSGFFGPCMGQVLPRDENCNHRGDEDCNGSACSDAIWDKVAGDAQDQFISAVAIDQNGNTYAVGSFQGTINLGGSASTATGQGDMFLAEFDPTGKKLWENDFVLGGNPNAGMTSVAVSSSGDIAITGYSQGASITFGATMIAAAAHDIGFVGLFAGDGTQKWVKPISGSGDVFAASGAVDANDNVVVAGHFTGALSCTGSPCPNAGTDENPFLRELDSTGAQSWSTGYGSSTSSAATTVAMKSDGRLLVAGTFSGSTTLAGKTLVSKGDVDVFVFEATKGGSPEWAIGFGSTGADTGILAVRLQDDSFVVGGAGAGEIAIGSITTGSTNNGAYLFSFDDKGKPQWAQSYGSDGASTIESVAAAFQGDVYIAGVVGQGKANFGGGFIKNTENSADAALTKLDGDGNVQWSKKFVGPGFQGDARVASNGNGYTAFSLSYQNTVDFGLGPHTSSNSDGEMSTDMALVTFQP